MPPNVLIVIPNWNGEELLCTCLKSIYETTDYEAFEIVVVDNDSDDDSVTMVRSEFPEVTLIENEENRGWAGANNQIMRRYEDFGADYLLLLNNDTEIVDSDWLTELVSTGEAEDAIGVVGCEVLEPNGDVHYRGRNFPLSKFVIPRLTEFARYNRFQRKNDSSAYEYVDDVTGAVYLLKASVVDEVGLFDEGYEPAYFEESDYSIRVWNAGFKIAYTDATTVVHHRGETGAMFGSLWKMHALHRNSLRFYLINYPVTWILLRLPLVLLRPVAYVINSGGRFGLTVRPEFRDDPMGTIRTALDSYLDVLSEWRTILAERRSRRNVKKLLR